MSFRNKPTRKATPFLMICIPTTLNQITLSHQISTNLSLSHYIYDLIFSKTPLWLHIIMFSWISVILPLNFLLNPSFTVSEPSKILLPFGRIWGLREVTCTVFKRVFENRLNLCTEVKFERIPNGEGRRTEREKQDLWNVPTDLLSGYPILQLELRVCAFLQLVWWTIMGRRRRKEIDAISPSLHWTTGVEIFSMVKNEEIPTIKPLCPSLLHFLSLFALYTVQLCTSRLLGSGPLLQITESWR